MGTETYLTAAHESNTLFYILGFVVIKYADK